MRAFPVLHSRVFVSVGRARSGHGAGLGEMEMEIRQVGVVGAGTMGNGIAHVFARSGYSVVLCDVGQRFLDRGLETITKNLDCEVAKNKITLDDKASTLKRIESVVDRPRLADCEFIMGG